MKATIRFRIAPNIQPEPPEWTLDAACLEYPGDMFYPEKGGDTAEPKRVCRSCPVRAECLTDAMEYEAGRAYRHGVAGGLSVRERHRLAQSWRPGDELPPIVMPYEMRNIGGAA